MINRALPAILHVNFDGVDHFIPHEVEVVCYEDLQFMEYVVRIGGVERYRISKYKVQSEYVARKSMHTFPFRTVLA